MTSLHDFRILETLLWVPASLVRQHNVLLCANHDLSSRHLQVATPNGSSIVFLWSLHLDRLSKALLQLPVNLGLGSLPREVVQMVTTDATDAVLAHILAAARHASDNEEVCLRIRLLVDLNGRATVQSAPIPFPSTLSWSIPICPPSIRDASSMKDWWAATSPAAPGAITMHLDLSNPISTLEQPTLSPFPSDFLIHKTTHRTICDSAQLRAKSALNLAPDVWIDVLLHTRSGFITESCIANIAVLSPDTQQWTTPKIDEKGGVSLLPGCMRSVLLDDNVIHEGYVPLTWVTELGMPVVGFNSVRGCFPVNVKLLHG
ncbi:hypothetical protein BCR44DRAFT_26809 [Catenaria anguillulae PL171]|uniref:Aminotransferase n=1 Tax=Catenaria anguillulae PL171 TaxID=765915 RepID=A0A1Y2HR75_9FUNG|nr:hypothetical protein BCR44DRAFT_26809 [Catenaria anguillulae PL171]